MYGCSSQSRNVFAVFYRSLDIYLSFIYVYIVRVGGWRVVLTARFVYIVIARHTLRHDLVSGKMFITFGLNVSVQSSDCAMLNRALLLPAVCYDNIPAKHNKYC